VDARYRTLPGAAHRAIMGKSSGGFGAMITPMLRPDLFGALATHAGDTLYEYCYLPEFGTAVRHLRRYDGDIWRWWRDFGSRVSFTKEEDMSLLSVLGVAACFSANEDGSVDLPFDPATGAIRPTVWQRWLDWDPVRMVPSHTDALRGLRLSGSTRARGTSTTLTSAPRRSVPRSRTSESPTTAFISSFFEAGHMGIDYRYPVSLAWLCSRITLRT